jgi:hypothetical protein
VLAAVGANAWGGSAQPSDFFPSSSGEQTPDEMAAVLTAFAAAYNE